MTALIAIASMVAWLLVGVLMRPLVHRFDDTMIGFGTDDDDAMMVGLAVLIGPALFGLGVILSPILAVGWLVLRRQRRAHMGRL